MYQILLWAIIIGASVTIAIEVLAIYFVGNWIHKNRAQVVEAERIELGNLSSIINSDKKKDGKEKNEISKVEAANAVVRDVINKITKQMDFGKVGAESCEWLNALMSIIIFRIIGKESLESKIKDALNFDSDNLQKKDMSYFTYFRCTAFDFGDTLPQLSNIILVAREKKDDIEIITTDGKCSTLSINGVSETSYNTDGTISDEKKKVETDDSIQSKISKTADAVLKADLTYNGRFLISFETQLSFVYLILQLEVEISRIHGKIVLEYENDELKFYFLEEPDIDIEFNFKAGSMVSDSVSKIIQKKVISLLKQYIVYPEKVSYVLRPTVYSFTVSVRVLTGKGFIAKSRKKPVFIVKGSCGDFTDGSTTRARGPNPLFNESMSFEVAVRMPLDNEIQEGSNNRPVISPHQSSVIICVYHRELKNASDETDSVLAYSGKLQLSKLNIGTTHHVEIELEPVDNVESGSKTKLYVAARINDPMGLMKKIKERRRNDSLTNSSSKSSNSTGDKEKLTSKTSFPENKDGANINLMANLEKSSTSVLEQTTDISKTNITNSSESSVDVITPKPVLQSILQEQPILQQQQQQPQQQPQQHKMLQPQQDLDNIIYDKENQESSENISSSSLCSNANEDGSGIAIKKRRSLFNFRRNSSHKATKTDVLDVEQGSSGFSLRTDDNNSQFFKNLRRTSELALRDQKKGEK